MKRITNLARVAMLFFAVLGSTGTRAQSEVVTVGSGGRASSYLPCYPNNTYSMSQQIYTADEIGKAGMITSIAFYNYDMGSARECDIYLSNTAKTTFDSSTDWVTVSAENMVFSGTMNLGSGWTVIDFDTPFQYDGTQNLLLTVDDNTGKDTGSNFSIGTSDASSQALYYYKMFGTPANLDPTQSIEEEGTVYYRKNHIKLCFETYPKPYKFEAAEVGDASALIQCSLRGDATAWNLRYRKVAAEGEQEQRWVAYNDLTERSFTIEDLTPATQYEAQVQAVFPEDNLSDWTDPLGFTTSCCPVEQQAEIIYALNSDFRNWYNYAAQIIDITDEEKPVEVAHLCAPSYQAYGGSLTLCCGHKYKVNWIYDEENPDFNKYYSLALYFEPGDLFYSMTMGTAPEETAELTTFVMDCTPYCTQKPQNVNVAGVTFNSATISFASETKNGEVVYSTDAAFDPDTATPASIEYTAISVDPDSWEPNPANASVTLTGLEPLTEYYVRVRNVCVDGGNSRWSDPVKVTTGSRYDAPSQVIAKSVNSRTEQLSWGSRGNEKVYNLYYRQQAAGNPVNIDDVGTFGSGHGEGFENGNWGEGIWSSYSSRPFSNTLFVSNIPAGSSFGFKAGQGKTGFGQVKFLYGMKKLDAGKTAKQTMEQFDKKCLNDADRAAIIKGLKEKRDALKTQLAQIGTSHDNGEITDDEYNQQKETLEGQIDAYSAEITELESLPTDAEKLARMKELESKMGAATDPEEKSNYARELNELRAITSVAENPNNDGFSITNESQSPAHARGRMVTTNDTYIFFIRHADDGVLLVKDLTITPPEQVGEWTCIPNLTSTEYMLTGLEPGTTYEVMVEPIYEGGTTGTYSAVTVFATLGAETDPTESEFSVAESKKVHFAKGNLRCEGDRYEAQWSMAKQQYEVLGQDNIEVQGTRSYPAWLVDLFCWSTLENYYGISSYNYYNDEEAQSYFNGEFAEWGECPTLIRDLGAGWQTLSKDEWNYLLNERANAAQLKSIATVNGVKGLMLLPDEWTAPDDAPVLEGSAVEMTAEQWAQMDAAGAVFLPAAGQMTSTYVDYVTTTTVAEAATYWTSTPSDGNSGVNAYVLTIGDTDITLDSDLSRRVATAVRLVKSSDDTTPDLPTSLAPVSLQHPDEDRWYTLDGRRLATKPSQRGIYIIFSASGHPKGKKVVVK